VLVEEGMRIHRGQIIATLSNDELQAQVVSAEAVVREKEAALRHIVNGARQQERLEALANVKTTEALLADERQQSERRLQLLQKGAVSREEAERSEQAYAAARARHEAALQHYAVVNADAREEDVAKASADVDLARGQLEQSRARLAKTIIRSPINGVVLRKHRRTGEAVLDGPATPVVTLGDVSSLRVRAEVDESDICLVAVGQKGYVTADAYGSRQFPGKIVRVGSAVGRKQVITDEPSDKDDRKVLDVLLELQPGSPLKPGLRVDTFIQTGDASHACR